jgi:hypothetical protein
MANEANKPSWWQTAPGLMTATAAVIAAITGLIGGLNQIGVLDRFKQPAAVETASRPSPLRDSAGSTAPDTGAARTEPGSVAPSMAPEPRAGRLPAAVSPSRTKRSASQGTPAADSSTRASTVADTGAAPRGSGSDTSGSARVDTAPAPASTGNSGGQIPSGTLLELAAASRICSTTSEPGDRVPATVVVPVTGTGGAVVPVGTTAVLEVTRLEAPAFLGLRADSLSLNGRGYVLRNATARVHQREFTAGAGQTGVGIGACIPAGGRITVTLRSPVTFSRGS